MSFFIPCASYHIGLKPPFNEPPIEEADATIHKTKKRGAKPANKNAIYMRQFRDKFHL
jgi:hypothetical protein